MRGGILCAIVALAIASEAAAQVNPAVNAPVGCDMGADPGRPCTGADLRGAMLDSIQVATPIAGGTIVVPGTTAVLFVNNPVALTSLTVALPASPANGQRFTICARSTITTIGFTGAILSGALSTMSASGWARFTYSADLGGWFRTG